jgi:hypothetical protein
MAWFWEERQANANELRRETLRLAFENPSLFDPTSRLADFDYESRTIDGSSGLFQKYEILADTVLNASDEILGATATKEWQASVPIQLRRHRDYLQSRHLSSGYLERYPEGSRAFVQKALEPQREQPRPIHPDVAPIDTPNRKARKRA